MKLVGAGCLAPGLEPRLCMRWHDCQHRICCTGSWYCSSGVYITKQEKVTIEQCYGGMTMLAVALWRILSCQVSGHVFCAKLSLYDSKHIWHPSSVQKREAHQHFVLAPTTANELLQAPVWACQGTITYSAGKGLNFNVLPI